MTSINIARKAICASRGNIRFAKFLEPQPKLPDRAGLKRTRVKMTPQPIKPFSFHQGAFGLYGKDPIHFTARLQYSLRHPSGSFNEGNSMLSLFRNPFYPRKAAGSSGPGRYIPNIYNEFHSDRVVYSQVHDGIMEILDQMYSEVLAEDFDAEFRQPNGSRRTMHLVLSGSLSEVGAVSIEDCCLTSGRFRFADNVVWIEE